MNSGTEHICGVLIAEAQEQADAILRQAEEEAGRVKAEAEEKANAAARAKEADAKTEFEKYCVSTDVSLELFTRDRILGEKREIADGVFEQAKAALVSLDEENYRAILISLLRRAGANGNERVIFNTRDAERLGRSLVRDFNFVLQESGKEARLTLSEETRDIDGGFILDSEEYETDCSISAVVDMCKDSLLPQVLKILF